MRQGAARRQGPAPYARSVIVALPGWVAHSNQGYQHRALGYRSPRDFIAARPLKEALSAPRGSDIIDGNLICLSLWNLMPNMIRVWDQFLEVAE